MSTENTMNNDAMKPIETIYNGHTYPSKLQAQQAVYMDKAGFAYENEPECFNVGNGLKYRPDFLLHGAWFLPPNRSVCYLGDVYIEVKGKWRRRDAEKVERLCLYSDKNVLTVDNVLWPGVDYYDEMYDTTLYKILAKKMQEVKEAKEESGVGSKPHEFTLFNARKCNICSRNCENVTISDGLTKLKHEFCHTRYPNMALCVGVHDEPVICCFLQETDDNWIGSMAEEFARTCSVEKTRNAYLAACQAFNNDHDSGCYKQAHDDYGTTLFDEPGYDDELPF